MLHVVVDVCLSVTIVSHAKTGEPIEMPFGLRTLVGPSNHILDGVQIPPWEGSILRGSLSDYFDHWLLWRMQWLASDALKCCMGIFESHMVFGYDNEWMMLGQQKPSMKVVWKFQVYFYYIFSSFVM